MAENDESVEAKEAKKAKEAEAKWLAEEARYAAGKETPFEPEPLPS